MHHHIRFFITALLLVVHLPAAFAEGVCEIDLTSVPTLLTRYRLRPEAIALAEGDDLSVLRGMARVFSLLDDASLTRLGRNLREPSEPDPHVDRNPFFRVYPSRVTALAAAHLPLVRATLGDTFGEFELGLIASTLPAVPKVRPEADFADFDEDVGAIELRIHRRIRALLAVPRWQKTLVRILEPIHDDFRLLEEINDQTPDLGKFMGRRIDASEVGALIDRVRSGRASSREAQAAMRLLSGLVKCVLRDNYDRFRDLIEDPALEIMLNGTSFIQLSRQVTNLAMEHHFVETLGLDELVLDAILVVRAVTSDDPLPLSNLALRQAILTNAEHFVGPIWQKLVKSLPSAPAAPVPTPRGVAPLELRLVDHFAPAPVTSRRRDRPGPAATERDRSAPPTDAILPNQDLRAFSSFVKERRPLEELRPGTVYGFWFVREERSLVQRARFGREAIDWMTANPAVGRQILNALNLGISFGKESGLKFVEGRSRRHDGPIYEIKIFGNVRPLVISRDGVWQVISVVHKDDVSRAIEWLAPLG